MFNSHVKFRHSLQLNWRMEKPWRMAQPHVLSKRPWKPWKPWTSPAPRRGWLKLHPSFPGQVFHISMATSSHHPYFNIFQCNFPFETCKPSILGNPPVSGNPPFFIYTPMSRLVSQATPGSGGHPNHGRSGVDEVSDAIVLH